MVTDKTLCPLLSWRAAHQRPTSTKAALFDCQGKRDSLFTSRIKLAVSRRLRVSLWLTKESEVENEDSRSGLALPGPSGGHRQGFQEDERYLGKNEVGVGWGGKGKMSKIRNKTSQAPLQPDCGVARSQVLLLEARRPLGISPVMAALSWALSWAHRPRLPAGGHCSHRHH